MCQHIVKFCSGSTKLLLFVGSSLTFILSIAIGYTATTTQALYQELDSSVAQEKSLSYYIQIFVAIYLISITIFACFAAHYDEKHSIRVLAIVASLNFILASAAILMVPSANEIVPLFAERLNEAHNLYDFTDKPKVPTNNVSEPIRQFQTQSQNENPTILIRRDANNATNENLTIQARLRQSEPLTRANATIIWDRLQSRGCCGLRNATEEWKDKIPKSCCANPEDIQGNFVCKQVDSDHNQACMRVIGSTSMNLLLVIAMIALVNLYLATVTSVSAYRTLHYNEASQDSYS